MLLFTNDDMRNLASEQLEDRDVWTKVAGRGLGRRSLGPTEGSYNQLAGRSTDKRQGAWSRMSTRIRNHPLVPNDISIYGYIYGRENPESSWRFRNPRWLGKGDEPIIGGGRPSAAVVSCRDSSADCTWACIDCDDRRGLGRVRPHFF